MSFPLHWTTLVEEMAGQSPCLLVFPPNDTSVLETLKPLMSFVLDAKAQAALGVGADFGIPQASRLANFLYYLACVRKADINSTFDTCDHEVVAPLFGIRRQPMLTRDQAEALWLARVAALSYCWQWFGYKKPGKAEPYALADAPGDLASLIGFNLVSWTNGGNIKCLFKIPEDYPPDEAGPTPETGWYYGKFLAHPKTVFFPRNTGLGFVPFSAVNQGEYSDAFTMGQKPIETANYDAEFCGLDPASCPGPEDGQYFTYKRYEEASAVGKNSWAENPTSMFYCWTHLSQWNPLADAFKCVRMFHNMGIKTTVDEQVDKVVKWFSDSLNHNPDEAAGYYDKWFRRDGCGFVTGENLRMDGSWNRMSIGDVLSHFDDFGGKSSAVIEYESWLAKNFVDPIGKGGVLGPPVTFAWGGCHNGAGILMHVLTAIGIPCGWFTFSASPGVPAWSPLPVEHIGLRIEDRISYHSDSLGGLTFDPPFTLVPMNDVIALVKSFPSGGGVDSWASLQEWFDERCKTIDEDWSEIGWVLRFLEDYGFYRMGKDSLNPQDVSSNVDSVRIRARAIWCQLFDPANSFMVGPWDAPSSAKEPLYKLYAGSAGWEATNEFLGHYFDGVVSVLKADPLVQATGLEVKSDGEDGQLICEALGVAPGETTDSSIEVETLPCDAGCEESYGTNAHPLCGLQILRDLLSLGIESNLDEIKSKLNAGDLRISIYHNLYKKSPDGSYDVKPEDKPAWAKEGDGLNWGGIYVSAWPAGDTIKYDKRVLMVRLKDANGVPLPKVGVWFDAYRSWVMSWTDSAGNFKKVSTIDPDEKINAYYDSVGQVSKWVILGESKPEKMNKTYPTFFVS